MSDAFLSDLFRLRSEDAVMQYIARPRAQSMEDIHYFLQLNREIVDRGDGMVWEIVHREKNALVGNIGYWRINKENFRGEVGYASLEEYWGQGLMSEALDAVLAFGFEHIGFHTITADIDPMNVASAKLLERHGFVREAYLRENFYYDGKFLDSVWYGLLDRDFRDRRSL